MLDFFHISTLTNYQKINCYMLTIFGIRSFLMLCSDLICISNTCNEISRILMWSYRNHLMGKCICASLLPYVNYGNCAVIDQQKVVCFKHATFEHQYKYALGSEDTNLKPKSIDINCALKNNGNTVPSVAECQKDEMAWNTPRSVLSAISCGMRQVDCPGFSYCLLMEGVFGCALLAHCWGKCLVLTCIVPGTKSWSLFLDM